MDERMRETERNGREMGERVVRYTVDTVYTPERRIARAEDVRGKESSGERAERLMVSALNN